MASPRNFGRRGLAPPPPPQPQPQPRRLRSGKVAVGAIGLLALGLTASAGYREYRCRTPERNVLKEGLPQPGAPVAVPVEERPECRSSHSYSHSSSGHSWGLFSGHGGGLSSHASFGGFGAHGSAHGGGS